VLTKLLELGPNLWLAKIGTGEAKEQDSNARMMEEGMFAQLTANIRKRSGLESLPFCATPKDSEEVEIVSGHHRFQAAAAAGLKEVFILYDDSGLSRQEITAKQIAHNAIEGFDDPETLKQLLASIGDVDLLLETFIGADQIQIPKLDPIVFPDVEFSYRTLSFAFLPHQMASFDLLMDTLAGRQDFVGVAEMAIYDDFVRAVSRFARVKKIGRVSTALALITEVALKEVATIEALEALDEPAAGDEEDDDGPAG